MLRSRALWNGVAQNTLRPVPTLRTASTSMKSRRQEIPTVRAGELTSDEIQRLPSTPSVSPSYPRGPYRFMHREYFIVTYESDRDALRSFVPAPLVPNEANHVLYEWIAMPDSSGFGNYQESGIVIPCTYNGQPINFTAAMLLDCEPPIACGREIWGFPKKRGNPKMEVSHDTLVGTLEYADQRIATGTMAFKYSSIPHEVARASVMKPCCNLKIIPHPHLPQPSLAQLISFQLQDVEILGAWSGPARLHLESSSGAPLADLPVRNVLGGKHILANLTLPHGKVLYDYNEHQNAPVAPLATSYQPGLGLVDAKPELSRQDLTEERVLSTPSMPAYAPSFPHVAPSLAAAESMMIVYETNVEAILPHLPEHLELSSPTLYFQVSSVQGTGMGEYARAQLHVPCRFRDPIEGTENTEFLYSLLCIADCSNTITFGRERWGKPFKYGFPSLVTSKDTLVCSVKYGDQEVVRGSMMYKHFSRPQSFEKAKAILEKPELNLKVIPHASGAPSVCQLVGVTNASVNVSEVYEGHAALDFIPHVHAPFSDFPVVRIENAFHFRSEMVHSGSRVLLDYLSDPSPSSSL